MNVLREALLAGRRRPRRAGAGSPLAYAGDGYEFSELRAYVAGDDVRRIDWAASARSGELQTRVLLEDVALTLACIVDTSASMNVGRKRLLAQGAGEAAKAWIACAEQTDRVVCVAGDDIVAPWPPFSGAQFSMMQSLRTAVTLPYGCALLVISDFFDLPADDELLLLLGHRLDCTALVASDPWREDLPLSGFVRVRDAETRRSAHVFLGRAERRRYARAVAQREASLFDRLERCNWRAQTLAEDDGETALLRAFGVR